jgi:hypothetical protein
VLRKTRKKTLEKLATPIITHPYFGGKKSPKHPPKITYSKTTPQKRLTSSKRHPE